MFPGSRGGQFCNEYVQPGSLLLCQKNRNIKLLPITHPAASLPAVSIPGTVQVLSQVLSAHPQIDFFLCLLPSILP
ncbi:hypothetical protein XELAEV_18004394mg [Xenopus laevis]|uniref:Uncharacterized protein n=1 Tax=Xenopus laevis TaxID=8355 RepID=A0A974GYX9_XENLA|nr:hypothetical protein XELAEV_18004394mg [Xenopus laevis]